ncbi:dihydroorotate dehydrogenase electron transfer subunit [Peptostreptococcus russellii]|uniref:dihydroorotate dehydrogenase electron transfer subunit n=1 Tax=Peptostreptococcus russellii TaxID=215200 RepID=UPI003F58B3D7
MDYKVIENRYVGEDMYYIKIAGDFDAKMGQFFMLRAWDNYPLLSRPISIYNIEEDGISFLYKVVGEGTKILSKLDKDDDINLQGPYGNGYEKVKGRVALVGGGVGIAPLYMVAQNIENCDCYLGFREEEIMIEDFEKVCKNVYTTVGDKFVTDIINPKDYDYILTCGPTPMMKKIVDMTKATDTKVQVSLENRMACGVGACLVCTCKTKSGNKKTCKDGPVFWGEDVIL